MSKKVLKSIEYGKSYYNFITNKTCRVSEWHDVADAMLIPIEEQKVYSVIPNHYQHINEDGHCSQISITIAHMFLTSNNVRDFTKSLLAVSKALIKKDSKVKASIEGQRIHILKKYPLSSTFVKAKKITNELKEYALSLHAVEDRTPRL